MRDFTLKHDVRQIAIYVSVTAVLDLEVYFTLQQTKFKTLYKTENIGSYEGAWG